MDRIESVGIRRAGVDDIAALKRVEVVALRATNVFVAERDWEGLFDDGAVFTYLAEDENPFGYVTVGKPRENWFQDGVTGEVISLCVLPEYQGKGVGRRLLVHGLSVLKRRQFEHALVWIREGARRGERLLTTLGFTTFDSVRTINLTDGEITQYAWTLSLENYF